ncbi:MAG: DVU_1556 family methyltransferase [Bacillota bacterium]|nr:class I SAM-dependent methyltransferase [Bacillota bacterium]HWR56766.1 class I SAM-dependent methyltransferase [Negativicutes bacterium]
MNQQRKEVGHRSYQNYPYMINKKTPDGVLRPGGLNLTKYLIDACAFRHKAKVADVGCGTGITVQYLRDKYGLSATGVDISATRLQQGRARTAGLRLLRAAAEALPFADDSLDGVLMECSLSVMQDADRVLAEVGRVLSPGGKLGITDMYFRSVVQGDLPPGCEPQLNAKAGIMTRAELAALLAAKGFNIITWEERTDSLKEFVARFIMEHGSAEALCQCLALRQKEQQLSLQALKKGLGYFLLLAEKRL